MFLWHVMSSEKYWGAEYKGIVLCFLTLLMWSRFVYLQNFPYPLLGPNQKFLLACFWIIQWHFCMQGFLLNCFPMRVGQLSQAVLSPFLHSLGGNLQEEDVPCIPRSHCHATGVPFTQGSGSHPSPVIRLERKRSLLLLFILSL